MAVVSGLVVAGGLGATVAASGASTPARAAASKVTVTLKEFTLRPSPTSAAKGKVTFSIKNAGKLEHELIVIRTKRSAAKLPVRGNRADESGKIAEAEDIRTGTTRKLTVTLKRGHYVLICNIAGHYKAGQRADFTAR